MLTPNTWNQQTPALQQLKIETRILLGTYVQDIGFARQLGLQPCARTVAVGHSAKPYAEPQSSQHSS